MSMPEYVLHDFITTAPSCVQTTPLAAVLEIFRLGQCDCLVVVSEQQCPVGILSAARLMPYLLSSYGCAINSNVQQSLWTLDAALIEPIAILPAQLSVEQFGSYLRSQQSQTNTGFNWAVVDSSSQYLGLLDSTRLLQFLASLPEVMNTSKQERVESRPSHNYDQRRTLQTLAQLLELLPWPLMLQTGAGEVVTQNPAWRQQFRALSDLEAVRSEVEAILKTYHVSSSSHCQSGTQPGTCICIWPHENGQERVWQFVKIPLQSGLKFSPHASLPDASTLSTDLWLLAATDVTEQQLLASELAAKNADLIQLNRLKDEFLACISHELKTPITAVMGLSTLLKDQALGELNERQAHYARLIHQSGRHLMIVVNDILDLTRMETGQLELTLEPVKIASVCDRAIEQARTLQPKSQSKAGESLAQSPFSHRFNLVIEPGLDSFVADELRLRQMLVHLLSNAFKFTEADGEVGLRVSRWEGWIAFTVWDTGIGIPEQKQHLIFQKFQQLESPLTRQFEGTGLGLVLTRALARMHGGDVSFLSKQGKGSEFTLLLPPIPPYKRAISGAEGAEGEMSNLPFYHSGVIPTPQKNRNRLVLVVEAAPRFIEDLTEQLTALGYRVVIARSGTEALEKARRLQPGAVFLNPLLPLLSGWDVLTLLKSDAATRQIPLVVTATRAEKEQAFSNRADEFLSLPVQQQTLQQVLVRFCPQPSVSRWGRGVSQSTSTDTPLTVLHLSPSGSISASDSCLLNTGLLHQHHYRVLEADDLEQAELLARVWQPHVVLLNGAIPEPLTYLQQLSQHPHLAVLPLVTQDAATTQAAIQVTGLSIFPCLTEAEELNTDALLPVLQIAAGMSWKPNLLLVDVATLTDLDLPSPSHPSVSRGAEWFQALLQYLETAGFRGMMSRSWAEVLQQIRQQSVDLLLICLEDSRLEPAVVQALTALDQQHEVPPVLILPPSLSMEELLDQIHQTLASEGNSRL